MSRIHLWLLITMASVLVCAPAHSQEPDSERILSFHSDIVVDKSGSMSVTETITVQALGFQIKHGILRDLPTDYRDADGKLVRVWLDVRGAQRDGKREQYTVTRVGNGISIRIGDPEYMLPHGTHTYVINYVTARQLGHFPEFDELYWNVTGNGWDFPIDQASATVQLPAGIASDRLRVTAYTGPSGAQGKDFRASFSASRAEFITTAPLGGAEGLTIVVQWPLGIVARPTAAQLQGYWLLENFSSLLAVLGVLIALLYFWRSWRRVGVDPPAGFIAMQTAPPEQLSPAAVRYVKRMAADGKAFTAAVVSLATKGALTITDPGGSHFILSKVAAFNGELPQEEAGIVSTLFGSGNTVVIDQENRLPLVAAQETMRQALALKFDGVLFKRNTAEAAIGIVISVFAVAIAGLAMLIPHVQPNWAIFAGSIAAQLLIVIAFAQLMPAYTQRGRSVLDSIEGFRLALHSGPPEGDKAAYAQLYAEGMLPYSIALEVHNEWSRQFERALKQQSESSGQAYEPYSPYWYHTPSGSNVWLNRGFSGFTSHFTSTLNSSISSASTPPGSSSGGGGGGSSGGGGGGGGGGGW